jgi:hypothetical protein
VTEQFSWKKLAGCVASMKITESGHVVEMKIAVRLAMFGGQADVSTDGSRPTLECLLSLHAEHKSSFTPWRSCCS